MIGAIIGDLAAWTYENDKDTFWKQLISEDCEKIELSVYGHAYFRAASRNVLYVPKQDVSIIRTSEDLSFREKLKVNGQWLMWQLMCAWHDNLETPRDLEDIFSTDKEEGYARMFVIGLIRCLRKGMTKVKFIILLMLLKILVNLGNGSLTSRKQLNAITDIVFCLVCSVHGIRFIVALTLHLRYIMQ